MPRSCKTVHVTFAAISPWPSWLPWLSSLSFLCPVASKPPTMKAVSYGPVPLKEPGAGAGLLAQDDWMVEAAKPMWGLRGRDDLGIVRQLGANTVRLYGNNPKLELVSFQYLSVFM